jgi:hypothetical protein
MSTTTQKYEITFAFIHCNAFATVQVDAFDETHAIRLAESVLSKELIPQLYHISLCA